ncbi:histidinol-phosphatase HisJ family protein [Fusibacter bizertensis]
MHTSKDKFKMDFHTHCNYSPDSDTPMEEMIIAAIKKGITDLSFTDHVDIDADIDAYPQDWDFDRDAYEKDILNMKGKYQGQIAIYQGLEIGVQPHLVEKNSGIVKANDYDFVIASVHSVERRDLYHKKFFENHNDKDSVMIYYSELEHSLRNFDAYSVLGHLDLYLRYKPELKSVPLSSYEEIVREILKKAIENGKGIELNAGGYRYGIEQNNPGTALLKIYKELKGEIITLGSDAHRPDYLGYYYEENCELLKHIGFKYITTFEKMKPVFHKL